MSTDVTQAVRDLRPRDAARVDELFSYEQRIEILEGILREPRRASVRLAPQDRARGLRYRRLPCRLIGARPLALVSTLGVLAAAIVLAVVLLSGSAVTPQPAKAAVSFYTSPSGDYTIAVVKNPFVAKSQLDAAFAARGLHIMVNLVPVSPSLVGAAVFISDPGAKNTIQPLQKGPCTTPGGGGCLIGVKIPKTFTGQGDITLGRPAKPGEQYASAGNATAPGEAMHGLHYQGRTVATVLAMLHARHVTVPQYRRQYRHAAKALRPSQVPGNWHVQGAIPWAPGQVLLFVRPGA